MYFEVNNAISAKDALVKSDCATSKEQMKELGEATMHEIFTKIQVAAEAGREYIKVVPPSKLVFNHFTAKYSDHLYKILRDLETLGYQTSYIKRENERGEFEVQVIIFWGFGKLEDAINLRD